MICERAIEDVAEGAGDGAESIVFAERGAIGCGAAKMVAEVGFEVAGGGEKAAKGFVCCVAAGVADWKSSKSSSASKVFDTGAVVVPFDGLAGAAGSSSKLKRSFTGSAFLGGGGCDSRLGRLAEVVATVLRGGLVASSSPASYSSKSSPLL